MESPTLETLINKETLDSWNCDGNNARDDGDNNENQQPSTESGAKIIESDEGLTDSLRGKTLQYSNDNSISDVGRTDPDKNPKTEKMGNSDWLDFPTIPPFLNYTPMKSKSVGCALKLSFPIPKKDADFFSKDILPPPLSPVTIKEEHPSPSLLVPKYSLTDSLNKRFSPLKNDDHRTLATFILSEERC